MKVISLDPDTDNLLHATGVHQRLSGAGLFCLGSALLDLINNQDDRLAAGEPVSRIPLLWRSLAESVGLTVDNDGRITDGPRQSVPGL